MVLLNKDSRKKRNWIHFTIRKYDYLFDDKILDTYYSGPHKNQTKPHNSQKMRGYHNTFQLHYKVNALSTLNPQKEINISPKCFLKLYDYVYFCIGLFFVEPEQNPKKKVRKGCNFIWNLIETHQNLYRV